MVSHQRWRRTGRVKALTNMGPDLALNQARIPVSNRDEVPETRTPEVRLFYP
jgi:hypothetical protein